MVRLYPGVRVRTATDGRWIGPEAPLMAIFDWRSGLYAVWGYDSCGGPGGVFHAPC